MAFKASGSAMLASIQTLTSFMLLTYSSKSSASSVAPYSARVLMGASTCLPCQGVLGAHSSNVDLSMYTTTS